MFVLGGMIVGGISGAMLALKRGGTTLDAMQYAAGYGIAFAVVGLIATIALHRAVLV